MELLPHSAVQNTIYHQLTYAKVAYSINMQLCDDPVLPVADAVWPAEDTQLLASHVWCPCRRSR